MPRNGGSRFSASSAARSVTRRSGSFSAAISLPGTESCWKRRSAGTACWYGISGKRGTRSSASISSRPTAFSSWTTCRTRSGASSSAFLPISGLQSEGREVGVAVVVVLSLGALEGADDPVGEGRERHLDRDLEHELGRHDRRQLVVRDDPRAVERKRVEERRVDALA